MKKTVDTNRPARLILQDGSFIDYDSLMALGMNLGIDARKLHKVILRGYPLSNDSLMFCRIDYTDGLPAEEPQEPERLKERPKVRIPANFVTVSFPDGSEREFDNMAECAKELDIAYSTVKRIIGTGKSYKGYRIEKTLLEKTL